MTIAHVASAVAAGTMSGGANCTLNSTGADLIVVSVHYYRPVGAPTLSDSRGNTWTALTARQNTNGAVIQYYCLAPSVGSGHVFTSQAIVSSYQSISAMCFSGVSAYESEAGATGSGTSLSAGSITPIHDGSLLITAGTFNASSTETATYGGLQQANFVLSTDFGAESAYLIQTTAAATSNTFSGSSAERAASMACFVAAGAASVGAGVASTVSSGNTIATVTATDATNGTAPYTYQWQRSLTPGSGFSNVSGATSLTLNDTGLTNWINYYYRLVYTDAVLDTATSNETTASPVAPLSDIAVSDASIFFSPYNWRLSGSTYAETNNPGSYIKVKFTGAVCTLLLDTTNQSSLSASEYPTVAWSVNSGTWSRSQITSGQTTLSLATALGAGPHTLELVFVGAWYTSDRWTTPVSALRVTGFRIESTAALSLATLQTGRMILFADSNGEGYEALAVGLSVTNQDAGQAFPLLIGRALDCEVGVVAFASQGYTTAGSGNVPDCEDAWDFYSSGNTRLVSSLFSPVPDFVVSHHGQNDSSGVQAAAESCITQWLAASGAATKIVLVSPIHLGQVSAISAAVTAAANSRVKYVTTGDNYLAGAQYSSNVHLSVRGHARYAATVAAKIRQAFGTGGTNTDEWDNLRSIARANGLELIEQ